MNNVNVYISVMLMFFFFVSSCTSDTEEWDESKIGYDFYPLEKGKYWIYASDSIIYDDAGTKVDTFRSFIKEEVGDKFTDDAGEESFRVLRYFKRDIADKWTSINMWTTSLRQNRAIKTEENLKFVKLVFPVKKGLRWDGNVFIDKDVKIDVAGESIEPYKNWKYRMEETDAKISFNGAVVPSLKINLVDESSIIDRRKVIEYYGKGIGLLRKEMTILDSDGSRPNDAWEKKAKKGFIHILTLLEVK